MTLKELIKSALIKKGMSQVDLADRINVTPAQVSRIISGERSTSIETYILIADTLNINRDVMLRTAAGLKAKEENADEWVEGMNHKMKLLPPTMRPIAEKLLNSLLEDAGPAPAKKPKRA